MREHLHRIKGDIRDAVAFADEAFAQEKMGQRGTALWHLIELQKRLDKVAESIALAHAEVPQA